MQNRKGQRRKKVPPTPGFELQKHVSSNHIDSDKFIIVCSAQYVSNSTNISVYNISISNSNGIGLLMYDTNGTVNIMRASFISNKPNAAEHSKSFTGGGGIYIEFTNCSRGLLACDSDRNLYNKFST